jgi:hypothetical protein
MMRQRSHRLLTEAETFMSVLLLDPYRRHAGQFSSLSCESQEYERQ